MVLTSPSLNFLFPFINTIPPWHTGQSVQVACHVCMHWAATLPTPPPPTNKSFLVTKTPSRYYFSANNTYYVPAPFYSLQYQAEMPVLSKAFFHPSKVPAFQSSMSFLCSYLKMHSWHFMVLRLTFLHYLYPWWIIYCLGVGLLLTCVYILSIHQHRAFL